MKNMRKVLALLLAFCMLASLGMTAMAAQEETTEENKFDYVVLGASMTNGYGMRYYLDPYLYDHPLELSMEGPGASGYRDNVEGSYPQLVKDALISEGKNVELHQLAQSSMRVEELRYLLDESYSGDEYTRWRFYNPANDSGWWGSGNLEPLRADYQNSIRNAELITYDLGVNNFGVYLSNRLLNGSFAADFANIVGEEYAGRFYQLRDAFHKGILTLVGQADSDIFETLDHYADTLAYAMLGYIVNFDATMKTIRELNPDCDIVVVSIQNPMAGIDMSIKGITIPFGEIFGLMIDMANGYTANFSPYRCEYYYADVQENGHATFFYDELMAYDGDPTTLSQNTLDCFNVYDRKLHANMLVKQYLVAAGVLPADTPTNDNTTYTGENSDIYQTVLYSVYDALARILQAAGKINPMPMDGILAGESMGTAGDELMAGIGTILASVADSTLRGLNSDDPANAGYDLEAAVNKLLSSDGHKVAAVMGMRTSIGNTFFTHPSPQGHREIADGVLRAYHQRISGARATVELMARLNMRILHIDKLLEQLQGSGENASASTNIVVDLGSNAKVKYVLVNGVYTSGFSMDGTVLTVPCKTRLASTLTVAVEGENGKTVVQTYTLTYQSSSGYTANRIFDGSGIGSISIHLREIISNFLSSLMRSIAKLFPKTAG